MSDARTPILLVGSVPLRDEQEVFSAVSGTLGDRIRAIPDGETGERTNGINWQKSVMDQAPMLGKCQHVEGYGAVQVDLYSRKPDAASDAVFPPLGYASAALKSYRTFEKLLADGKIASGTRFMVALPTPFAPMMSFIEPGSFEAIAPLYEMGRAHVNSSELQSLMRISYAVFCLKKKNNTSTVIITTHHILK